MLRHQHTSLRDVGVLHARLTEALSNLCSGSSAGWLTMSQTRKAVSGAYLRLFMDEWNKTTFLHSFLQVKYWATNWCFLREHG